jgi:hypothetical protein
MLKKLICWNEPKHLYNIWRDGSNKFARETEPNDGRWAKNACLKKMSSPLFPLKHFHIVLSPWSEYGPDCWQTNVSLSKYCQGFCSLISTVVSLDLQRRNLELNRLEVMNQIWNLLWIRNFHYVTWGFTHRPDDGGSTDLWNFCKLIPVYAALQCSRQPSSGTFITFTKRELLMRTWN